MNDQKQQQETSSKTEFLAQLYDDVQSAFFGVCACRTRQESPFFDDSYRVDGNVFSKSDTGNGDAPSISKPPLVLEFEEQSASKSPSMLSLEGVLQSMDVSPDRNKMTQRRMEIDDEELTFASSSVANQNHIAVDIPVYQEGIPNIRSVRPSFVKRTNPLSTRRVSPASSNDSSDASPAAAQPMEMYSWSQDGDGEASGDRSHKPEVYAVLRHQKQEAPASNILFRFSSQEQNPYPVVLPQASISDPSTATTSNATTSLAGLHFINPATGLAGEEGMDTVHEEYKVPDHDLVPWE